ncbi:MAG: hypothetical protein ACLGIR_09695 [Actinomycetes bacterium]
MELLLVPAILVLVAVLVRSVWSGRSERDPGASIESFTRALSAIEPRDAGGESDATRGSEDVIDLTDEPADGRHAPVQTNAQPGAHHGR